MKRVLKPEYIFRIIKFQIQLDLPDFNRLDMKTFWKHFVEGEYHPKDFSKSFLEYKGYRKSFTYDRIPRCARFNMTESHFRNLSFQHDKFYDYDTPENLIIKEYCLVFLTLFPGHEKTSKILKEIKKLSPEFFI